MGPLIQLWEWGLGSAFHVRFRRFLTNHVSTAALFLLPDPVSFQSHVKNMLGMGYTAWGFPSLISFKPPNRSKKNCWSVVIEKETEAQRDAVGPRSHMR